MTTPEHSALPHKKHSKHWKRKRISFLSWLKNRFRFKPVHYPHLTDSKEWFLKEGKKWDSGRFRG